jgi:hypothetical protein
MGFTLAARRAGRSSMLMGTRGDRWVTGKSVVMEASSTPGIARTRRTASLTKVFKLSGLA